MQKHGSFPYDEVKEWGMNPARIIDFSASVNPFPLPIEVLTAYKNAVLYSYPERSNNSFLNTISAHYNLKRDNIVPCSGTTECIYVLPILFDSLTILAPAYSDYCDAFYRHGKQCIEIPQSSFSVDTKVTTECLVLVNPSNPTGEYFSPDVIRDVCQNNPQTEVIIDEAYQELGENCESVMKLTEEIPNLTVLRSLTKSFAIAGLRAGFIYGTKLPKLIKQYVIPWNISKPVQDMVPKLFENFATIKSQWNEILYEKKRMLTTLDTKNIQSISGKGPFFLISVGNSTQVREQLLKKFHLHVRDCASFGLEGWIRVMPNLRQNNDLLIEALNQCL